MKNRSWLSKRPAADGQKGFSITELMVASLLIVTMVLSIFSTVISVYKLAQPQGDVSQDLARQKIEQLYEGIRGDWWNDTGTTHPLNVGGPYTEPSVTIDNITYTRTYTVSNVSNASTPRQYRRVDVDVSWT